MRHFHGVSRGRLSPRAGKPALLAEVHQSLRMSMNGSPKNGAFAEIDLRMTGVLMSRKRLRWVRRLVVCLALSTLCVYAQQRFPPPDFESGHKLPATTTP